MPLHRRLPKRGFRNIFAKEYSVVNLGMIQKAIDLGKLNAAETIDAAALNAAGVTGKVKKDGVRLLGNGELTAKVSFTVAGASKSAIEAIEKAGGSVTLTAPAAEAAE